MSPLRWTCKSTRKLATYPSGIKVSDEDLRRVNLTPAKFHGKDWNYAIKSSQ